MGGGGFSVLLVFVTWLFCGLAGFFTAEAKSAGFSGLLAGLLLGPLGIIVALGLDQRPRCPRCQGRLDGEGQACQHCGVALRWPRSGSPILGEVATQKFAQPVAAPQPPPR